MMTFILMYVGMYLLTLVANIYFLRKVMDLYWTTLILVGIFSTYGLISIVITFFISLLSEKTGNEVIISKKEKRNNG